MNDRTLPIYLTDNKGLPRSGRCSPIRLLISMTARATMVGKRPGKSSTLPFRHAGFWMSVPRTRPRPRLVAEVMMARRCLIWRRLVYRRLSAMVKA